MLADPVLLLVLALLGAGGARIAARACRVSDPSLARALGLPISLSLLLLVAEALVRFVPVWVCLAGALALVGLLARACRAPLPEPEVEPLTKGMRWLVGLVLVASVFYLHLNQLARPSDDFWIQYPLTRSLFRGNFPPVNPYFPDLPLQGQHGRPLLMATLSSALGGDTLRGQWITELVLLVNSAFLWILALRRATGRARAGVLAGLLVFLGVNVGSRVGLMDTYDNENLLVYLLLGGLVGLGTEFLANAARRWPQPLPLLACLTLLLSACGAISATHFALAGATLVLGGGLVGLRRRSAAGSLGRTLGAVLVVATALSVAQGGALQDLGRWFLDPQAPRVDQVGRNQPIAIHFPKQPFLALRLGVDPYQRFSFALDTALFRRYQPALDDGGHASILGPKVLVLHWLPTWLAPLTLGWAVWRRHPAGALLGCFGVLAYLIPGMVDFGPVREAEYLRWEFASGVALAALLGVVLADMWERRPPGARGRLVGALIVLVLLVDLVGAQRRLNDLVIELQRSPDLLQRAAGLWYPSTRDWFAALPRLGLTEEDLEAALWLSQRAGPNERLLTDFRAAGHDSLEREAALAGLAGVYPVGHSLPPRWRPVGRAPDLPSEPTVAFRQVREPRLLAGLGVNWLLWNPGENPRPPEGLTPAARFGHPPKVRYLYRLEGSDCPGPLVLDSRPTSVQVRVEGLPAPRGWAAGTAYPVTVQFSQPLAGWLAPVLREANGTLVNRLSPVTVPVQGDRVRAWLVPPLEEGDYRLSWAWSPGGKQPWRSLLGETPVAYRFSQAIEEALRVERVEVGAGRRASLTLRNIAGQAFWPGGPVRIQGWVWDPERHRYRVPSAPEAEQALEEPLGPGASQTVHLWLKDPLPPGGRVDVTAAARYGPSITVPRREAPETPSP